MGCLTTIECFAGSIQELNGKVYVSPGAVYVAPNAIYVNIAGDFISVEGIACDSEGVYIQNHDCERAFICGKCGKKYTLSEGCPK